MASPRTIQTPRLGVGRTSLTAITTNSPIPSDSLTNEARLKDTKCFIKVVLPTLDDGLLSNAGKTSPEINLVTADDTTSSHKPENVVSVSHKKEFQIQTDHARENEPERPVACAVGLSEENDLTTTLLKMYDENIRRSSTNERGSTTPRGLEICTGKTRENTSARRRTNITRGTTKQKINPINTDKQLIENISGNFVDISAWQTDLEKSPKTERTAKSQRLYNSRKHLRKGFVGSLGELPYIFDHSDDLPMYIKDHRQTNNYKSGLSRNYTWDEKTKLTNKSLNGLQGGKLGSSPHSRFGVKTTDPTAKSFLSPTHRYSADIPGGCVMCEKEKFRLRNSFPKRVYLSWSQYMTLCKSNSFLMSNEHHTVCNSNSPKWQSPPRAMTSHTASRPLLTSRRDRSFEEQCKFDDGHRELVEKKTSQNHQSGTVVDKTLLVYRLSGKKRTPVKSGKSDLNLRNDLQL